MVFDTPDIGSAAVQDSGDIVRFCIGVPDAVYLNQRLQPVHAPAGNALYFGTSGNKCCGHGIGTTCQRNGIVGNPDNHDCATSSASFAGCQPRIDLVAYHRSRADRA